MKKKPQPKPNPGKGLIGEHPSIIPQHPKANWIVSKGKTPDQKGARLCKYCGSGNHWDFDCPHSEYQKKKKEFQKSGKKQGIPKQSLRFTPKLKQKFKAKTHFAEIDPDAYPAFVAYLNTYLEQPTTSEEEPTSSESESGSDSENPQDFQ